MKAGQTVRRGKQFRRGKQLDLRTVRQVGGELLAEAENETFKLVVTRVIMPRRPPGCQFISNGQISRARPRDEAAVALQRTMTSVRQPSGKRKNGPLQDFRDRKNRPLPRDVRIDYYGSRFVDLGSRLSNAARQTRSTERSFPTNLTTTRPPTSYRILSAACCLLPTNLPCPTGVFRC